MLIIQLTGLSGAGKTCISNGVKAICDSQKISLHILDGDTFRNSLCKDLSFSKEDRCENIRRLGAAAQALTGYAQVALIAAINPYNSSRRQLKINYHAKTVWVDCDIPTLVKRDTKGLYRRALLPNDHPQKILNLSGINDVFETPDDVDCYINTARETLQHSVNELHRFILAHV